MVDSLDKVLAERRRGSGRLGDREEALNKEGERQDAGEGDHGDGETVLDGLMTHTYLFDIPVLGLECSAAFPEKRFVSRGAGIGRHGWHVSFVVAIVRT